MPISGVLTQEQKTFIVQQNAMYRKPAQVVEAVKRQFDIEISRHLAIAYHPEHRKNLAPIWCDIFAETRKKFVDMLSEIPLAHQAYRLTQLQDSLDRILEQPKKNEAMIHDIVERAAKEIGGMFTNRRELTGANGKPLNDPVEMARDLYQYLMSEDDADKATIVEYLVSRYKVPETVLLLSEAEN